MDIKKRSIKKVDMVQQVYNSTHRVSKRERLTRRNEFGRALMCVKTKSKGGEAIAEANTKIINRLAELEDKIESGLLFEPPCKIGDTIFYIIDFGSVVGECINIEVGIVDEISFKKDGIFIHANYKGFKARHASADIGKVVFFNQDQAEAKLKEL